MSERTQEQFLMTVPAHQPNIDYAVRQLFGGDADVSPKVTVLVNVNLTAEQRLRLYALTDQDLKAQFHRQGLASMFAPGASWQGMSS